MLSSSRGQGNFWGLEASRPRPRTWKCVLEDVVEAKDVLEDSTSGIYVPRNNVIIVTFYINGCSQFENPEAPDFEKNASASSSFSTRSFPLPTYFMKVLRLPQKNNRFHRFCFQLPLPLPHPWSKSFTFWDILKKLNFLVLFLLSQKH